MVGFIARVSVAILVLRFSAVGSCAPWQRETGKEPGFWEPDAFGGTRSVVYAEVVSVKPVEPALSSVVLEVRATLSGVYDAAADPTITVTVYTGSLTAQFRAGGKKGTFYFW